VSSELRDGKPVLVRLPQLNFLDDAKVVQLLESLSTRYMSLVTSETKTEFETAAANPVRTPAWRCCRRQRAGH
jgi:hypothetical protein